MHLIKNKLQTNIGIIIYNLKAILLFIFENWSIIFSVLITYY